MRTFSVGDSLPWKFKIGAEAIMLFGRTDHSHKFISWKDDRGFRWVAEARGGGVRMISNKRFKDENMVVRIYQYNMDEEEFDRAIEFVWKTLATDYSYAQILGIVLMRAVNYVFRLLGMRKRINNPFRDGLHSMVCNEFAVTSIVEAKGVFQPQGVESWDLSETSRWNHETCDVIAPQEKIAKINGLK